MSPARGLDRTVAALGFGGVFCCLVTLTPSHGQSQDSTWPEAGRQGLTRIVIVPTTAAQDRAAYAQQIDRLCAPHGTCFLNFYANPGNLPVTLPLPDAIAREATAVFRRSTKQGAELLRFSCRLQLSEVDCF